MRKLESTALYLRNDGSLMLASGGEDIEITLQPGQLVTLAFDLLRVALRIDSVLVADLIVDFAETLEQGAEDLQS